MTRWLKCGLMVGAMAGALLAGAATPVKAETAGAGREVTPEKMMTLQERMAFRDQMRNAQTPAEREALMVEKMAQLRQRAAEHGAVMAENGGKAMANGNGEVAAEAHGARAEAVAPHVENGPGGKVMRPRPPAGH